MKNWKLALWISFGFWVLIFGFTTLVVGCGEAVVEPTTTTTSTTTSSTTTTTLYSVTGLATWTAFSNTALPHVLVTLEGATTRTTTTDAAGRFTFSGTTAETYTLKYFMQGWTFTPTMETFSATGSVTKSTTVELTNWTVIDPSLVWNRDFNSVCVDSVEATTGVYLCGDLGSLVISPDNGNSWTNYTYGLGGSNTYPSDEAVVSGHFGDNLNDWYAFADNGTIRHRDGGTWGYDATILSGFRLLTFKSGKTNYNQSFFVDRDNKLYRVPNGAPYTKTPLTPEVDVIGIDIYETQTATNDVIVVGKSGYMNTSVTSGETWTGAAKLLSTSEDLNGVAYRQRVNGQAAEDVWVISSAGTIFYSSVAGSPVWTVDTMHLPVEPKSVDSFGDTTNHATYICGKSGLLLKRR